MKILEKTVLLTIDMLIRPIKQRHYSKTITRILPNEKSGGGSYSHYYKLSENKGIKLLKSEFDTFSEALNSHTFEQATKEHNLLIQGKKRFYKIPKSYGVRIILKGGKYKVGIVMQHLEGVLAHNCDHLDNCNQLVRMLEKELESCGINHSDIHGSNIIWYKNDWWVIDFGPDYVTI